MSGPTAVLDGEPAAMTAHDGDERGRAEGEQQQHVADLPQSLGDAGKDEGSSSGSNEKRHTSRGASFTDGTRRSASFDLAMISDPTQKERVERNPILRRMQRFAERLSRYNIEGIGIAPITVEQRRDSKWWSPGLLWFSANVNVLTFSGGTLAPILGLGMVASQVTILLFSLVLSLPAAYFSTFGPQLGMRQMVQSRYSWGYFPACLACLLNALGMIGFMILNNILGGQTLSAVSKDGHLSPSVGIVIIAIVSLLISFSGIRVLHIVERWLWLPVLICFCILIGIAGTGTSGLHVPTNDPALTSSAVLGMGAVVAGYLVAWAPLASDVTHYLNPEIQAWKLFTAVFLGFFLSTAPFMMLGAAFGVSALDNQAWSDALNTSNGALFNLVLSGPGGVGNFGRFVTVLLALSAIGNIAATLYSFGLTLQTLLPFLAYVPRFFWPILATAITLPLSIVGASAFYTTLSNFTYILGYWASLFVAIVLMEHVIIRRRRFASYNPAIWNNWRRLSPGIAALASAILSIGIIVPSMEQEWFTGPIAQRTGDLGFELGFVVCCLLYIPLRLFERHVFQR